MRRRQHPAERALLQIATDCPHEETSAAIAKWLDEHIRLGGCESLLDKDAHGKLKPEHLRELLGNQAKTRRLEMARLAVEDAALTEDFDIGYAVGQRTYLWVLR